VDREHHGYRPGDRIHGQAGRRDPCRLPFRIRQPIVALLLFASAPVSSNARFGQVSLLLGLLVLLDTLAVMESRLR